MKAKFSIRKWAGEYWPVLTIGVQSFKFGRGCVDKETAKWYCDQMRKAINNLKKTE